MYKLFVVPSKKFCDVVILDGLNSVVLDMILSKLRPCIHPSVKTGRACPREQTWRTNYAHPTLLCFPVLRFIKIFSLFIDGLVSSILFIDGLVSSILTRPLPPKTTHTQTT